MRYKSQSRKYFSSIEVIRPDAWGGSPSAYRTVVCDWLEPMNRLLRDAQIA